MAVRHHHHADLWVEVHTAEEAWSTMVRMVTVIPTTRGNRAFPHMYPCPWMWVNPMCKIKYLCKNYHLVWRSSFENVRNSLNRIVTVVTWVTVAELIDTVDLRHEAEADSHQQRAPRHQERRPQMHLACYSRALYLWCMGSTWIKLTALDSSISSVCMEM